MKNFKNQKGITLVALIITIIVLIILAAVTIISVNNMGLVPLAINGTQNYAIAQENEGNLVNGITDLVLGAISNIENGGTGGSSDEEEPEPTTVEEAVTKNHTFKKTTELKDKYENSIVIPAGFRIVKNEEDNVEYKYTETDNHIPSVQDGIVIEDAEGEDAGNQFVWIPTGVIKNKEGADTTIELARYKFEVKYVDNSEPTGTGEATPVQKASECNIDASQEANTQYRVYFDNVENQTDYFYESIEIKENSVAKSLLKFIESAKGTNEGGKGGYYIARYEASYDGSEDPNNAKPLSQQSIGNTGTLYAPKEAGHKHYLWNNITQPDASSKCKAMYEENDYESDLVNSYAWDTAIVFIQTYSENKEYSKQTSLNSKSSSEAPDNTGDRTKEGTTDKVCNIYDMASNCYEWTTETATKTDNPCIYRGGNCFYRTDYTGFRYANMISRGSLGSSFRPCLYITK